MSAGFHGEVVCDRAAGDIRLLLVRHPPGQVLPWHSHTRGFLALVAEGGYREQSGRRTDALTAGEGVLNPAGERHHDQIGEDGAVVVNLELTPAAAARLERSGVRLRERRVLPGAIGRSVLRRLMFELHHADELSVMVVSSVLLELTEGSRDDRPHAPPSWLRRVREALAEEPEAQWTLELLARLAGVHPHHLSRAFRQHHATSIGDCLRRLRARKALGLLATGLPLAEVALESGFCDQSHLTRWLKRLYGLTPATLKRGLGSAAGRRGDGVTGEGVLGERPAG